MSIANICQLQSHLAMLLDPGEGNRHISQLLQTISPVEVINGLVYRDVFQEYAEAVKDNWQSKELWRSPAE